MGRIFDCIIGEVIQEILDFVHFDKVVDCLSVNYSLDFGDEDERYVIQVLGGKRQG